MEKKETIEAIRNNRMRQEIFVLIVYLYTIFSSGTKTWYKGHSSSFLYSFSPTLEQSHTPLKEKKAVKKGNLILLEINLANLELDMEGIIITITGMIIELVNINSFRM